MALNGDVKPDEELNIILKCLAERGKDGEVFEKYNEYFAGDFILPRQLFTESNNSEIGLMEAQPKTCSSTIPVMLETLILWYFLIPITW